MKQKSLILFILLITNSVFSQIIGEVKSLKGETLPVVNIFIDNTYIGTTSNSDGFYELSLSKTGDYTIVFQYLGYKTLRKKVTINEFPFTLNATLAEEDISLDEVVINSNENPANQIIRNTIAERENILEKLKTYKADFYSRGLIEIKNAPKTILGQDVGDFNGALDSTRSGIIYLSETISKLEYEKPRRLKEKIIASKVSGNDNGFSFNSANEVDFNFYKNTFELGTEVVSPISDFAFSYYRYKLAGVFYDDYGNLINKIEVTPKRDNDKTFSGFIYIVEDQWNLYAVDLNITGSQIQIEPIDVFKLKQTFSYSKKDSIWALISQHLDFDYSIIGLKGNSHFTAVYSNYDFTPNFTEKTFTREVLSFEDNANKKENPFWNEKRPVPLTKKESNDYIKRDSLQIIRKSKTYLDSLDRKNNKISVWEIVSNYKHDNSYKNYSYNIISPILNTRFNTIQGWNTTLGLGFTKKYDDYNRFLKTEGSLNYGQYDKRLRGEVSAWYKFNSITRPYVSLSGGIQTAQFNKSKPFSKFGNTISSLFFENNFLKLYDKSFIEARYSQELFNGLHFYSSLAYEKRKPLFNSTDYVFIDDEKETYTSNNPQDPSAFGIASFETHNMVKLNVSTRINFAQDYLSYPDRKYNIPSDKFPTLTLGYEKGLAASKSNYNYDLFEASLRQTISIGNKGNLMYYIKGGVFANAEAIAFMDYHHFNGNQTHMKLSGSYLESFKNLPYYSLSTNNAYSEVHLEHNFKGYLLNKIPYINNLNLNLILGYNAAITKENNPYNEFSIGIDNLGIGKYRFLRVDYARSYQDGHMIQSVLFGLSF